MKSKDSNIERLVRKEGWEIIEKEGKKKVIAFGHTLQFKHPCVTYLTLYRKETNPEIKYFYMKKAHDYLWPDTIWHQWTEDRFRAHCRGLNYITWAGGASAAKSYDAAKVAVIFWLANPRKRTVLVASTTLESLSTRVWGYVTKLLSTMKVKLPLLPLGGNTPKILFPPDKDGGEIKDTLHGMFAVATKSGDPERTIRDLIGRHPEEAFLMVLDECTELTPNVLNAFANLDSGEKPFQVIGIGNSNDIHDLHGAMSTPVGGWESVDPLTMKEWETTRKNGICQLFSCYESPAIHEKDPEIKKKLSKFLITEERIKEKEKELGSDSAMFWRFVVGFWRTESSESVIISKQFIERFEAHRRAEWGGIAPFSLVAGLDPAFSTGGDECILRLAILGVDINNRYILDFREDDLLFKVDITKSSEDPADIQIAKYVNKILDEYGIPLSSLAVDATGQGRALGSVIQLQGKSMHAPMKIYSSKSAAGLAVNSFDVEVKSTYELWFTLREFIQEGQIRGLDNETMIQLSSRQVLTHAGGKKELESKAMYKQRIRASHPDLAHSPDRADAAALCLQSAIKNFGFKIGMVQAVQERAGASAFSSGKIKAFLMQQNTESNVAKALQKMRAPVANFTSGIEGWKGPKF